MKERKTEAKAHLSVAAKTAAGKRCAQTSESRTPATPDSEAIAQHTKEFEYKPRYRKRVLDKYQNLYTAQR